MAAGRKAGLARRGEKVASLPEIDELNAPVLICLLGNFRLLKTGQAIAVRNGGKAEVLLSNLALRHPARVPREHLMCAIWPNSSNDSAGESLNSLIYSLNKSLGDALGGAAPVLCVGGYYRLNAEAGVGTDLERFEKLVERGEQQARSANPGEAGRWYDQAVHVYRGDLCAGADVHAIMQREHLRARFLTLLARLADFAYADADYVRCWNYAQRILDNDPCREDAHRLVMRCHVLRGERAQALRQYRVCERILREEFDAVPEPQTTALFDQVRLDPSSLSSDSH